MHRIAELQRPVVLRDSSEIDAAHRRCRHAGRKRQQANGRPLADGIHDIGENEMDDLNLIAAGALERNAGANRFRKLRYDEVLNRNRLGGQVCLLYVCVCIY